MVLYIRDPKAFNKTKQSNNNIKTPLSVDKLRKGPGFKINTQKLSALLYTNEKHTEKEIRGKNTFTAATKI